MSFDLFHDAMSRAIVKKDRELTKHLKIIKALCKADEEKQAFEAVLNDLKYYPRHFQWEE